MKWLKLALWVGAMSTVCAVTVQIQGNMKSYVEKHCTHLKEYCYFHEYNRNQFFNGFTISESWRNGVPFYRLYAKDEGIEVQIDKNQTEAKVEYLGKSLCFSIGGFIRTNANLYLADLTGDGFFELVYEEPVSGISGSSGSCVVVELQKMKILEIKGTIDQLQQNILVEQVADKPVCKVTDSNHHIYFGEPGTDVLYPAGLSRGDKDRLVVEYDRIKNQLRAYTCFSIPGCEEAWYLGDISASYEYNATTQNFELAKDYVVTLWNPVVQKKKDILG